MTGSGDERAAAGHGRLRASHVDREQVIELLKVAFVQGRLDKDEFDTQVARAFAARTYAELAVVSADIPAGLIAPSPAADVPAPPGVSAPGFAVAVIAETIVASGLWAAALATGSPVALLLALALSFVFLGTVMLTGSVILESRKQKPSGSRAPQNAGACG